jgi:hypothetical protein
MRLLSALATAALVGLVVVAAPARATVVVIPTLEEMTLTSDVVARITVGDARVVKDHGRLLTLTSVEVKDGIKGAKTGDVLTMWQIGGSLDGRESWIVGAHHFVKGEELVLFAMNGKSDQVKPGDRVVYPYGIGVGLFEVKPDMPGAPVNELLGDVAAVEMGADGKPHAITPQLRHYDSFDAFKNLLVHILANPLEGTGAPPPYRQKLGPQLPKRPAPSTTIKQGG